MVLPIFLRDLLVTSTVQDSTVAAHGWDLTVGVNLLTQAIAHTAPRQRGPIIGYTLPQNTFAVLMAWIFSQLQISLLTVKQAPRLDLDIKLLTTALFGAKNPT